MTHPPGNPPSDPGTGDGTTGPGRQLRTQPGGDDGMNPQPKPKPQV